VRSLSKRLLASFTVLFGSIAATAQPPSGIGPDMPLKIRIYEDGRLTLNGGQVSPVDLRQPLEEAARNGRDVWVYIERSHTDEDPLFRRVMGEIAQYNLRTLFSKTENFAGASPTANDEDAGPSKYLSYTTGAENQKYIGNKRETLTYLANLELRVRSSASTRTFEGVFVVVVALRPNRSKVWLIPPPTYPLDEVPRLRQSLEKQPMPGIRGGVVAFAVWVEIPESRAGQQNTSVPLPDEWRDAMKGIDRKSLSPSELLDVVWPAEPRLPR
jgi:hypothetical protein